MGTTAAVQQWRHEAAAWACGACTHTRVCHPGTAGAAGGCVMPCACCMTASPPAALRAPGGVVCRPPRRLVHTSAAVAAACSGWCHALGLWGPGLQPPGAIHSLACSICTGDTCGGLHCATCSLWCCSNGRSATCGRAASSWRWRCSLLRLPVCASAGWAVGGGSWSAARRGMGWGSRGSSNM
jgi:hypothetical protein